MNRLLVLLIMLGAAAWLVLDSVPHASQGDGDGPQQRLVGTWLREYAEGGAQVRRILVLGQDGSFEETSREVASDQPGAIHHHTGRWIFDGTNLKRHYTRIDGKPTAAPTVPFATFQLHFDSNHEFTGKDHVHRREVRYRRVQDGAQP